MILRLGTTGWMGLGIFLATLLVQTPSAAQDQKESVTGRLVKILGRKGVLDDTEQAELRELEVRHRAEAKMEVELADELSHFVARIQDEEPASGYEASSGFSWVTADDEFKLSIRGGLQVRFTYNLYENNPATNDEDQPNFRARRVRIALLGHAFTHFRYNFDFSFDGDRADTTIGGTTWSSENRLAEVKNAWVEFAKWKAFRIRAGQLKVPYSRQWEVSYSNQQFVGRAITNGVFSPARSIGVMVSGLFGGENDDIFEYYAAVVDGEGENETNDDKGLMWASRMVFNPFGRNEYSEGDLRPAGERGEFLTTISVGGWWHKNDNHVGDPNEWSLVADIAAVWEGFFATIQLNYRENGVHGGPDVEIFGWMAQLGYMVIPETLEIALRAANIDWDHSGNQASRRSYLLILNYFLDHHDMKIQAEFGRVERHFHHHDDNVDDWRLRIQFQVMF